MSSVARTSSRRARLLAPVAVAAALVGGVFALSTPGSASTADEATLASLVNGARGSAGLPPLALSAALSDVARAHSAAMAASGSLTHTGNLAGAIGSAAGDWTGIAENVAVAGSVTEAHAALMESGEHRANVLGDFTLLGVGVVNGADGRVWVTETFAKSPVVAPVAPTPVPEPDPVPAEPVIVPTVDTTVASASIAPAPAPAPTPVRTARVKPARRTATPTRAAATLVVPASESCLPEQAQPQGQGHAYGRCDDVPRGKGAGRP